MKQTYKGGCQCGAVRYEVSADIGEVISCNCSRCSRLGLLLAFAAANDFKLISGEGAMMEFKFNKNVIQHLFCLTCGVQSFARGKRPSDGSDVVAINVRCLDDADLDSLKVKRVDGKKY
jgi:hypothetical protein